VPAVPDVEQVERVAAENAKSALEKIRKMSGEDKAVWECERKKMQWQVNRLREEALAAENARHGLEEMCSRSRALLEMCRRSRTLLEDMCRKSKEDKTVWQREREEIQGQVHRLRAEVLAAANAKASLDEMSKTRLSGSVRGKRSSGKQSGCERSSGQQQPHKRKRTDKPCNCSEPMARMSVRF
jgi:hypothetical protein